jgi:tetratricopeptide (TPR) repeat protein
MTMIKPIHRCHFILPILGFFWIILISSGCAHNDAPGKAFAEQTVQASSTLEKKGDLVNAVEELKVAHAADPDNSNVSEELNRLIVKRNQEAERHFKAGIAVRVVNPHGARKEFLEALRIRRDYPEVVTALRGLQLESAEAALQARIKKEAKLAETRAHGKTETAEDEIDGEEYSLDIAIYAFETGDYDTAIHEFGKMKARYPNDPDIQLYLDRSWYNSGIAWFTKKDYYKSLTSFAKVPRGFERVDDYVAKCRSALKLPEGSKVKPVQKKRR